MGIGSRRVGVGAGIGVCCALMFVIPLVVVVAVGDLLGPCGGF